MLSISHATTGAFVASKFMNPLIYVPAAVALHFMEDWIPHWDIGEGMCEGRRSRRAAFYLGVLDLVLAAVIIWWFWLSRYSLLEILTFKQPIAWHIMAGALAGILPDLIEAPKIFLGIEIKLFKPITRFHERFHHSIPHKIRGLIPQILLLIAIYFLR